MHRATRVLATLATAVTVVGLGPATFAQAATQALPAVTGAAGAAGSGGFTNITPVRVLDTRSGVGAKGALASGGTVSVKVTGVGDVPASSVSAVAVTLVATESTDDGYLTGYASGGSRPSTSSVNFSAGQTVSNLAMLPVGSDGRIALYNGAPGSTHVVADVAGYVTSGSPGAGGFAAVTPVRILDTRAGVGAADTAVPAGSAVTPRVLGVGGVPSSGVAAVVVNLTATEANDAGYITGYPNGVSRPVASSVNFDAGRTAANLAVLPVGSDGRIALYNGAPGSADFVADVAGYFQSGTPSVGGFAPVVPNRVLDTRLGQGASRTAVAGGSSVSVKVTGVGGVPASGVASIVVNVTVTGSSAPGYITGYASGSRRPATSNLNFDTGQTTSTLAVLPVGSDGRIALYNGAAGTTQLVADVAGYVAGDPVSPPGGSSGWPGAGNTGVPAGVSLSGYGGPMTITTPGTVIDAKVITGDLVIATNNVKITRSRVNGTVATRDSAVNGQKMVDISDSQINVGAREDKAVVGDFLTVLRSELTGGISGGMCGDCTIQDSWIHGQYQVNGEGWHESGYRMDQRTRIIHNTLACDAADDSNGGGCSADLTGYGDFRTVLDNTVDHNLFVASARGLSFCSYGGSSAGKPYSSGVRNIVFTNNVFQKGGTGQCGRYGPIADFSPSAPGNVWTNNTWDDGTPITP